MGNPDSIRELIEQRNHEYGKAWLLTGKIISFIQAEVGEDVYNDMIRAGYMYTWAVTLSKLIRMLPNPNQYDSWRDIAGYATLITDYIDKQRGAGSRVHVIKQGVERETT